jgi:hypothetical protein
MDDQTRFQFNKERLLALPAPADLAGRATYHDTKTTGLQLRVTPAGVKTFSMYRRTKGGGPERVTLGRFPAMTVEQARKAAATVNAEIEHGANPAEVKRTFKAEPTLTEFFAEYGTRHGEKKLSWRDDQQRFRDYLQKPLGDRKLTSNHAGDGCPCAFWMLSGWQGRSDGAPNRALASASSARRSSGVIWKQPGARRQGGRASRDP